MSVEFPLDLIGRDILGIEERTGSQGRGRGGGGKDGETETTHGYVPEQSGPIK